jgi:hypothetical protein
LDIFQRPRIAFKDYLGEIFLLNLSTGPLKIQNTAGIKSISADTQFNLPSIVLDNLRYQKAWTAVKS